MKLYHASKYKFETIKRNQVEGPDDFQVPESELQDKIYLTPDLKFAIAMAAGPTGMTILDKGKISFENAGDFNPEQTIYVYEVDSDSIPDKLFESIDDEQVAVNLDEIKPVSIREFKAKKVLDYYELVEWVHPNSQK